MTIRLLPLEICFYGCVDGGRREYKELVVGTFPKIQSPRSKPSIPLVVLCHHLILPAGLNFLVFFLIHIWPLTLVTHRYQ